MNLSDFTETDDIGSDAQSWLQAAEFDLPFCLNDLSHQAKEDGEPRAAEKANSAAIHQEPICPILLGHLGQLGTELFGKVWTLQVLGQYLDEHDIVLQHTQANMLKFGCGHHLILSRALLVLLDGSCHNHRVKVSGTTERV
jgi:hypothetical protein